MAIKLHEMVLSVLVCLLCCQSACTWSLSATTTRLATTTSRLPLHNAQLVGRRWSKKTSSSVQMTMIDHTHVLAVHDVLQHGQAWMQMVYHGLADASTTTTSTVDTTVTPQLVCPAFGQPGWGPFCFLNGNPVFQAFDSFQAFIQNSVVQLHDFLYAQGIQQAYGPSIILFTIFIRLILFPLNYQQIASTQMMQALNPKVQEIRERFPDNKDMQNQLVALLYQEAKVSALR